MPYKNELASKASHYDIVRNPEVAEFLGSCEYLKEPSEEQAQVLTAGFQPLPDLKGVILPHRIISTDGSPYEASINNRLPSTKVGYVKVGAVLIDMQEFSSLRVWNGQFVDPFRVAALQSSGDALTFILPSANVRSHGKKTVRDSFRAALDAQFAHANTWFGQEDPRTSLRSTLFHLAAKRTGPLGTNDLHRLMLHKCPTCGQGPVEIIDSPDPQSCPNCKADVYPTDCLRLWEEVSEFQSNTMVLNRFMLLVEHIIPIHYIRYLRERSLQSLAEMAFFVDGPLAIFGTAAWLSHAIMGFLAETNAKLKAKGHPDILMIGLQKTGQVVDYVDLIERFVSPARLFAVDDDYRYTYILAGSALAENGFGDETYYGQDFIFKTASGRHFVFALPYPSATKRIPTAKAFVAQKTQFSWYSGLSRALALIQLLESDLYENAVVPIALAHRFTAISLTPGGKVLDLLTSAAFDKK